MYSNYLKTEIPTTITSMVGDGNRELNIVPHYDLEDFILNNDLCKELGVQVHYTHIPTVEPNHTVFLCHISDLNGRRIEAIGESTPATLTNDIAKAYPALMAYKRAFDDAAIKYLGLDGKVYSDQQIELSDYRTNPSEKPQPNTKAQSNAKAQPNVYTAPALDNIPPSPAVQPPVNSNSNQNSKATKSSSNKNKKSETTTTNGSSGFSAPPLMDEIPTYSAPTSVEQIDDLELGSSTGFTAPPLDNVDISRNEFDVIVNFGNYKDKHWTIPQMYANDKGSLEWIAYVMNAFDPESKNIKELAQKYLNMMKSSEN